MEQRAKISVTDTPRIPFTTTSGKFENAYHTSSDASLFSTSLPVMRRVNISENGVSGPSTDDGLPSLSEVCLENEVKDPLEDISTIGSFLPGNEDELFAGLVDDFDLSGLPAQLEDLDDDFFESGGGLEIEPESQDGLVNGISKLVTSDSTTGNSILHYASTNGIGTVSGEHPYGEHPSRTLFVRNINSNVEDSELKSLFEHFGDIRTLYTACKHRGFVMISYYDIRAARTAMRMLQNKPLRRRKLDIHFSIPKDNPSEKDVNQGTLVVFNLDSSVSNDDLRQLFGAYGEVKEIRETPHKRHHKFIEFYDIRHADAALKALNRSDIAGKKIKLEPSRPGGARRSLIQQLSLDQEQDEALGFLHEVVSPIGNSPPGSWPNFGSPVKSLHPYNPKFGGLSPVGSNHTPGLASILPSHTARSVKIAPIGKDPRRINQAITNAYTTQGAAFPNPFSPYDPTSSSSSQPVSPFGDSKPLSDGKLSGTQFLWGSPPIRSEDLNSSPWSSSSSLKGHQLLGTGFPLTSQRDLFLSSLHVGSAPSGVRLEKHHLFPESPETSYINRAAFGIKHSGHRHPLHIGSPGMTNRGIPFMGNFMDNGSPGAGMGTMSRNSPVYFETSPFGGMRTVFNDGGIDQARVRRADSGSQLDNKRQYQLDLDKIIAGGDSRTTLMIKNIPNKYTSKMLLAAIDETHKGTYDFLYLPIDFKNKCNVGYAFINMMSPSHIVSFYEAFNGKKWEKFNSEKVASLAYARIQGKAGLVSHFQNSSLMNEDKRCRPIIFQSEGQVIDDLEPYPSRNLNICIRQPDGSYAGDSLDSPRSDLDEKPYYFNAALKVTDSK